MLKLTLAKIRFWADKEIMSGLRNEKKCSEVGCECKGFWHTSDGSGEKIINARVRHQNEWHVAQLPLAETVIGLIKRDPKFARHFQTLLNN